MIHYLSSAEPAILMSIFKPILFGIVLGFWGRVVGYLDKDLAHYYLPRRMWNLIQISAGLLAFFLWLMIPSFFLGLLLALVILGGTIVSYVMFRNGKLQESERWTFDPKSWFKEKYAAAAHAAAQARAQIAFTTKAGVRQDVPVGDKNPAAIAHAKVEELLTFALPRGAQRVDLIVGAQKAVASATVDGVVYKLPEMENKVGLGVVDYLKGLAKLDVEDRRKKQVGEVYLEEGEKKNSHLLRLTTIGSTREISLSLLVNPNRSVAMRLQDLGLLPQQFKALEPVIKSKGKTVIVTCPPGHGMTTTLYGCINMHDPYTQSIVTLEEDVAYEVEGVTHTRLEPGADPATAAKTLAALTRRDPSVLMVAKLADVASAKLIADNANDIRFYAGMKGEDTFSLLKTWIKAVGDMKKAADSLAAVIAPRLVRKLCTACRVPFKPDPAMLQKMNLPPEKVGQLYKASGKVMVNNKEETCPDCLGMGFRGRTGVFEVMVLDNDARKLVAAGQLDQLRAHLRKQRMLWLQEAALMKVVEGVTAVAEISRALAKEGA